MNNKENIDLLYYSLDNNIGDILNIEIFKYLTNFNTEQIKCSKACECGTVGIGSILDLFNFHPKTLRGFVRYIKYRYFKKHVDVWGTGFIKEIEDFKSLRKLKVYALRGKKTKGLLEKYYKRNINCVLADPGLLASKLLIEKQEKKYKIGIIPHYIDQDNEIVNELLDKYENSTMIDVHDNPVDFITKVAQCETVISSSLHGLVISDSLNIPNLWCKVSDKIIGNDFKYYDYYSSFEIENVKPFDLRKEGVPSTDFIVNNYMVKYNDVLRKQNELIDSFPYTINI